MINAFYSGVSGTKSFQNQLNVSANNLANANTTAFKSQQTTFSDLVYTNLSAPADAASSLQTGNGVKVTDITSVLEEGGLKQSDRSLDTAILGEGYFCIRDAGGNTYFTRAGEFKLQKNGQENYLVTANGEFVLDDDFSPVKINNGQQDIFLSGPASESENDASIHLAVVTFENPYALARDGYGRFLSTAASGEGKIFNGAHITQGALEGSNVDMTTEMSNLMQAQRGFQFSAKLIQTADELENVANNLRQS